MEAVYDGLAAGGLLSKLDFLYFFAAHDAQAGLLNWPDPTRGLVTPFNSPTFTVNQGYTGNGTSAYLQSSLLWTGLTKLVQDSAHIGAWVGGGTDAAADKYIMGAPGTTTYTLRPRAAAGTILAAVSANNQALGASATILGHTVASRRSSTDTEGYRNGVSNGTSATVSASKTGGVIHFLKTSAIYSDFQIKCAHAGSGLTTAEVLNLYNIINTYLTAIAA